MSHSNQVREFVLSDKGIDLVDVYFGNDRVLTGSVRVAQESQEFAAATLRGQDHQRKLRQLASRRKTIEAQIAAL
jgi:circadian clock protein KaiC